MKVYDSIIKGLEEAIAFEQGKGMAKTKRINKPITQESIKLTISEKPTKKKRTS